MVVYSRVETGAARADDMERKRITETGWRSARLAAALAVVVLLAAASGGERPMSDRIVRTDEEWRRILTPEQYRVTREGGTECAFSGRLPEATEPGVFACVCCGQPLFRPEAKFDSGTGWPSFFRPVSADAIEERTDRSHGMVRIEVRCRRCEAHLGHVFPDGPPPTGRRFCINAVALVFRPDRAADGDAPAEQ